MDARLKTILVCLCFSVYTQAQVKGDNTITVTPVTFKQAVSSLLDAGYTIERIDSNFQTLRTDPKYIKPGKGGLIRIVMRVKDSTAKMTADYGLRPEDFVTQKAPQLFTKGDYGFYFGQVDYRKSKGSGFNDAFEALKKFAFTIGTPLYSKE